LFEGHAVCSLKVVFVALAALVVFDCAALVYCVSVWSSSIFYVQSFFDACAASVIRYKSFAFMTIKAWFFTVVIFQVFSLCGF